MARGPPPRARGPLLAVLLTEAESGTTLACAGTTSTGLLLQGRGQDHLRVRGDHGGECFTNGDGTGPPPRARGPLRPALRRGVGGGTTPACAGTTAPGVCRQCPFRDHPRVRGDHLRDGRHLRVRGGPPPRARGPPKSSAVVSWSKGDHPRVRGDHQPSARAGRASWGPPPRARGPLPPLRARRHIHGTTPACAGTARGNIGGEPYEWDHPRVCGDRSS